MGARGRQPALGAELLDRGLQVALHDQRDPARIAREFAHGVLGGVGHHPGRVEQLGRDVELRRRRRFGRLAAARAADEGQEQSAQQHQRASQ
ncbi:MAG: hypothetical protein R3F59_28965 [Myxococcota bacterium]